MGQARLVMMDTDGTGLDVQAKTLIVQMDIMISMVFARHVHQ
jgi:hypothetical protein